MGEGWREGAGGFRPMDSSVSSRNSHHHCGRTPGRSGRELGQKVRAVTHSISLLGDAASMIGHPANIRVAAPTRRGDGRCALDLNRLWCGERPFPFVDFGMPVGKREAGGGIVVIGRLIFPRTLAWIVK